MRFLPLTLAILSSVISIQAQTPSDNSPDARAAAFTQRLLGAMSHRDMDALAAMFRFPASVHSGGVTLPIASSTALARAFDTVFTPELGCALEKGAAPGGRSGDAIRKESNGVSIGGGAVHLQASGETFAITRIEEPAGAAPAAPRAKPRPVDVPSSQVQFAGNLAAGGADRYVVAARPGDVLQARVERFQGRAIGVRVVDMKTGTTLSTGLDSARVVSATLQQPGDVAVDVTRLTFCEPSVSYLLTLTRHR